MSDKNAASQRASFSEDDVASANSAQALRRQAEARLPKRAASTAKIIESLSPEETRQMLHELQVHQIELEMQNEELRDAQVALEVERARFFDLYDLAPVGYCTVSQRGLIKQANLTVASLLGTTRSELLKQPWSRYIYREDADLYYQLSQRLVESGEPQSCELRMMKKDGAQFWAHWAGTVSHDSNGELELRAVLSDVTQRHRRERLQAFLLTLSDALRPLADPQEIQVLAADLLGEHLQVNQANYGEVLGEHVHISHSYANGSPPMVGTFHAEDFGKHLIEGHRAGRLQVCANTTSDPLFDEQERKALVDAHVGAYIAAPLVKEGVWVGVLSVLNIQPRDWAPTEVEAVQEVGERTWAAVERARAERALNRSEEKYRSLFESIDEGVSTIEVLFDEHEKAVDYRFLEINSAHEAMSGLGRDVIGKRGREVIPALEQSVIERLGQVALTGQPIRFEEFVSGLGRWFDIYLARAGGSDSRKVISVFNNITERKRAEGESREADKRKDEFLAMLAHELRNPLAAISSATQVVKNLTRDNATVQRPREVIERQVEHLTRLVDDLLDMSRLSWGKINLKQETLCLATVLLRTVEANRPLFEARAQHLTITLPPLAVQVTGDPTRLVQVFGNLLNNAAKYTEAGGHIALHAATAGEEAIIRVSDNGCGLSESLLPHVFELFTQAGRSLDRSQGGLGIGLALVQSLVDMHGGKVEAHSAGLGQGSEFVVRLPLARDGDEVEHLSKEAATAQTSTIAPRLKVLVVEDNADAADMLALILRQDGDEVRLARDGLTAVDEVREFKPQVVLCDIGLPGLSGFEVAARLREQPECRDTLLVALSGYGRDEDRRKSHAAGFDHHLTKPVEIEALAALIEQRRLI